MPQIITNQASIRYRYGETDATALSNIATASLAQPLRVDKSSLESVYRAGDELTYILTVTNGGTTALTNVTLQDTLGTFTAGMEQITPLAFVPDALLFIDGANNGVITPAITDNSITFTIPSLPGQSSALIVYKVTPTGFAPLAEDAQITNTVTASADGIAESVTDSLTVTADSYADVNIFKSMTTDGDTITYTFDITNSGNAPAEDIVLTDAFDPAPASITVIVNGTVFPATDYTYAGGVLTLPNTTGDALTLPPATITTDPVTGEVTLTPSSLTITVVGTL
ncbi:MAG: DUF11 domain-containing protein [Ruminococcaceae bacterium]|nr:DUF11 domain-containing protein [Oscillospiraceae bacterium]